MGADIETAAVHADAAAKKVDAAHITLHKDLDARHEELSGRHAAFAKQTTENVGVINAKFIDNDEDKLRRHVKTLKDAEEFTTGVETKLNTRADGLQAAHDKLRTHHTNLNGVVDTHTNNLNTAKNFMLDRFGGKKTWDSDCEIFGKWDTKQDAKAASPAASDMSESSTNGSPKSDSQSSKRRRLAADSDSLTRGHTVVLEALLEEINRQN